MPSVTLCIFPNAHSLTYKSPDVGNSYSKH